MDSRNLPNVSSDCGIPEQSNETNLRRIFPCNGNSEMSEKISDKSENEKQNFDIFSEYIKLENKTNVQQYSERNIKCLQYTKSQQSASINKTFPDAKICNKSENEKQKFDIFSEYIKHENKTNGQQYSERKSYLQDIESQKNASGKEKNAEAKICKKCLIPYFSEKCCEKHNEPGILKKATKRTSVTSTEKDSKYLTSISNPNNCNDSSLKFTPPSDNDLSVVEVLKSSTLLQEDGNSFSLFMQRNSVVVSKVTGIEKTDDREIIKNYSLCHKNEKNMGSSNSLLEKNTLGSDTVCSNSTENKQKFFCPHCSKSFAFRYILQRHILTHNIPNSFQGVGASKLMHKNNPYSGKSFKNSFSCANEESKFDSSNCILKKTRLHSVSAKLKEGVGYRQVCPLCSKSFRFRSTLERHSSSHKKTKNAFKRSKFAVKSKMNDRKNLDSIESLINLISDTEEDIEIDSSNCLLKEKSLNSGTVFKISEEILKRYRNKYLCSDCPKRLISHVTQKQHICSLKILNNAIRRLYSKVAINKARRVRDSGKNSNNLLPYDIKKEADSINCLLEENTLDSNTGYQNLKEYGRNKHVCPRCSKGFRFRLTLGRHILSHNINKIALQRGNSAVVPKIIDRKSVSSDNFSAVVEDVEIDSVNCLLKENTLNSDSICKNSDENDNRRENKYSCPDCSKRFKFRLTFERHIQSHNLHKVLQEEKGNKCFGSASIIKENVTSILKIPDILKSKLTVCKENDVQKPNCRRTLKYSPKVAQNFSLPYPCYLCLISFLEAYQFVAHLQIYHKPELQSQCIICNRIFRNKFYFMKHSQLHMRGKPFFCTECRHTFSTSFQRVSHICSHQKKRHICAVCSRGFQKKSDIIRHYFIHWSERPYPCNMCKYTAQKRHLVNIHIKNNHKSNFH